MTEKFVKIKGTKEGIILILEDVAYDEIILDIKAKFKNAKQFFGGAKVIEIKGKQLTESQLKNIIDIMNSFGIEYIKKEEKDIFDGIEEGKTKYVRGTLRSGRDVTYEGHVVVIGDVNPGAKIVAGGNIIIMGALRGFAHAGASGNKEACIVAIALEAKQIRIADVIGRAPDGEAIKSKTPEMALIRDGILTIEPYLQKK